MSDAATCGNCGAAGVKLYRPYGEFLRPNRFRCAACGGARNPSYVPCIFDVDGSVFGFTSAPPLAIEQWLALPDAPSEAS